MDEASGIFYRAVVREFDRKFKITMKKEKKLENYFREIPLKFQGYAFVKNFTDLSPLERVIIDRGNV